MHGFHILFHLYISSWDLFLYYYIVFVLYSTVWFFNHADSWTWYSSTIINHVYGYKGHIFKTCPFSLNFANPKNGPKWHQRLEKLGRGTLKRTLHLLISTLALQNKNKKIVVGSHIKTNLNYLKTMGSL